MDCDASSCGCKRLRTMTSATSIATTPPTRSLCVLEGEVLIEVDGESMVCAPGEMGIAPAGSTHGFLGLGAPALLEVFGEQAAGTIFLLADDEEIEVHRPGVPWDRPGPPTDMTSLEGRLVAPRSPEHAKAKGTL